MKVMGMFVLLVVLFTSATVNANEIRVIKMKCTGYCLCAKCCGPNACGLTSTGKDARRTVGIAADPKLLPYGTQLKIPGLTGIMVVDDTGGAMRQDAKKGVCHIDIRFKTHQEALNFGVKWLGVEIIN